jgi:regulator of protease activity HflC (stomatin/prohibitin superfamily)
MMLAGFGLGLALYALWTLREFYFRVDEGSVAVVSAFGAAKHDGDSLKAYGPGLHRKMPWERVHTVSLRERSVDLTGEQSQVVMADDGTVLRLDATLRFAPRADALEAWLFKVRAPMEHVTGLITCILRNEIANFRADNAQAGLEDLGAYAMLRRERQKLKVRLGQAAARKHLEQYGVRFDAVDLVDVHPPDELADALNAVLNAQIEAENLRFQTESVCLQRVLAAEEGVAIARVKAEAEAKELLTLGEHLRTLAHENVLDAYVARRRTEVLSDARTVFLKDGEGAR